MKPTCGECSREASEMCLTQTYCDMHKGKCFTCRPCVSRGKSGKEEVDHLVECLVCHRLCDPEEEAYYDFRCDQYICRYHFTNFDLCKQFIQLPCKKSCLESQEHMSIFMRSYCYKCARRKQCRSDDISLCQICHNPKQQQRNLAPRENCQSRENDQSDQSCQQSSQEQEPCVKPDIESKLLQTNAQLEAKQQQLKETADRLAVSQFTREAIKKHLFSAQNDSQCTICTLKYNLQGRKPLMICTQQHLLCEVCVNERLCNLKQCPICRELIFQKSKITYSRERMKTLRMQQVLPFSLGAHKIAYQAYLQEGNPKLESFTQLINRQVQTDPMVEEFSSPSRSKPGRPATRGASKQSNKKVKTK